MCLPQQHFPQLSLPLCFVLRILQLPRCLSHSEMTQPLWPEVCGKGTPPSSLQLTSLSFLQTSVDMEQKLPLTRSTGSWEWERYVPPEAEAPGFPS